MTVGLRYKNSSPRHQVQSFPTKTPKNCNRLLKMLIVACPPVTPLEGHQLPDASKPPKNTMTTQNNARHGRS